MVIYINPVLQTHIFRCLSAQPGWVRFARIFARGWVFKTSLNSCISSSLGTWYFKTCTGVLDIITILVSTLTSLVSVPVFTCGSPGPDYASLLVCGYWSSGDTFTWSAGWGAVGLSAVSSPRSPCIYQVWALGSLGWSDTSFKYFWSTLGSPFQA